MQSSGPALAKSAMSRDDFERAHFAAIVASSSDAIISTSLENRVMTWSIGAEKLFGYSASEATGRSISFLLPAGREDELSLLERVMAGESVQDYETVRISKEGTRIRVALTISVIRHQGAVLGVSKVFRDIARLQKPRGAPAESQAPLRAPLPAGSPAIATVLVVDDEELVLRTARMGLERRGYAVLEAGSSRAALEILEREKSRVSMVILDLSMPGMSGQELLPELRKIRPDLIVIASSGYSESETMRLFSGQALSGFIQKPYTVARLAEAVKAALGS